MITNRNRDLSLSYLTAGDTFGSGGPSSTGSPSASAGITRWLLLSEELQETTTEKVRDLLEASAESPAQSCPED
jgi:hypothetical protein